MKTPIQDLSFIPAYISAFLSAQYALAKNPTVADQLFTSTTSLFKHCSKSRTTGTLELWRIPEFAMIPICLVWATSISSIVQQLDLDRIYSSFMLISLAGTMGLGWAFELTADLVIFGLLPLLVVTALLVTRLAQNMRGPGSNQTEEQKPLTEKA
ncbi:hypothetical protein F5882DRAFT_806 [Hyaloscypha sp. PMI_1271]|nr:hypothetical protein F5882DRAFT_806 [Hyaloscypha sp. PMI_1271]